MTHTSDELRRIFPALDSLRAIAALGIVITHVTFQSGFYSGSLIGTAYARLDVGVAVFFVLSGFLLSRPYFERSAEARPTPPVGRYLWKRAVRVLPVYFVLTASAFLLIDENRQLPWQDWIRNFTLTDIYSPTELPDGLTQMWSLSTEVAFYLVLPLFMFLMIRLGTGGLRPVRIALVLGGAMLFNMVWIFASATGDAFLTVQALQWLPSFMTWFGTGIFFALAHVSITAQPIPMRVATVLSQLGALPGTCWTAAGMIFIMSCTPMAGPSLLFLPSPGQALTKNLLYAAIAGLLVLPGIFADKQGLFHRTMAWKPFRHLGHISYGLFSCHLVVVAMIVKWGDVELFTGDASDAWTLLVATLAVSLAVSECLYRFLEKPFMRLKAVSFGSTTTDVNKKDRVRITAS